MDILAELLANPQVQYRLRWRREGWASTGRTRYFSRRHYAERAQAKYAALGYDVQLDRQTVAVLESWAPVDTEAPPAKAATTCQHCAQEILRVDGLWVAADDPDTGWPYCSTEQSGGPCHAP